jgi:CHAT domain-containing protein
VRPPRSVIVADPRFGEPSIHGATGPGATTRGVTTDGDWSDVYFAPLAATGIEARAIKSLFPDATCSPASAPQRRCFKPCRRPSSCIASHGFFVDDSARDGAPVIDAGIPVAIRFGVRRANLMRDGRGDGILTALEASGLDLWGTKLVTLSACDTGVGEIRNQEGVYGLRRAFVLAGAETLVMSLWPVSDYIARDAMIGYYTRLRAGLGRGDALRQAKLAIRKHPARRHPYYWAGFIQSGEWAGLDGQR